MKYINKFSILSTSILLGTVALAGCSSDDDAPGSNSTGGMATGGMGEGSGGNASTGGASMGGSDMGGASGTNFVVTMEHVGTKKSFISGGIFNTPVGDASPGPATPGKAYEFTVNAGFKQHLSFVTMLAATNDLFYAPAGAGIALYDNSGNPITANVTDQIYLWDAGTEVNQEPHEGSNTVSQQAASNSGPAEGGNVVKIADTTDVFAYPAVSDVISVSVTHLSGTMFKIRIEDVSAADALSTSGGDFAAPLSPGVWVLSGSDNALFEEGMPDRGQGLEHIAEDGDPTMLGAYVAANEGITYPASPGVWVVHSEESMPLFKSGAMDYGDGLEHIAEDGNPTMLAAAINGLSEVSSGEVFNMTVGSSSPGPLLPGAKYSFSFTAMPGESLSFVSMLAATNDAFFAPVDTGIPLFDSSGEPVMGDVTSMIYLWDAGTEVNEEPAIGPGTVTNQMAADSGTDESHAVQMLSAVGDGYSYPMVSEVLKVTITHQ